MAVEHGLVVGEHTGGDVFVAAGGFVCAVFQGVAVDKIGVICGGGFYCFEGFGRGECVSGVEEEDILAVCAGNAFVHGVVDAVV